MTRKILLALLCCSVGLSGCASEVDKCVKAWEDAVGHVPNDNVNRFCIRDSLYECGSEDNKPNKTKAEAVAGRRIRCLRASQGMD